MFQRVASSAPQLRHGREGSAFSLARGRTGQRLRIAAIGGDAALKRRLRNLGLRPGNCIRIDQRSPAGLVISARGLKLALAPAAAAHVLVAPCEKG